MNKISTFAALIALSLGAGALAQSGGQVSALKGHDSNAPVDVDADRIEVQERADRAVFAGNVKARQGNLTLATARLTLAYTSGNGIQIRRLDASGGVVVTSPSETARGNFAVYDLDRKLITLIGNVRLARQGSTINGSRLLIDLNTGRAVMDGGAPGVGQSGGRVTGHFTVPQKSR
ncbi:MAG: OstA family protein [Pseudomonadota bacterium]|nr:OstA family protein [Pseudomonadota bacterium]